jgi:NTP pyrophosphatase (non-canonical NTP hydrolase)
MKTPEKHTTSYLAFAEELKTKAQEIASKINHMEASAEPTIDSDGLDTQLSELLFAAFILAESRSINLEEALLQNVENYILKNIT